MNNKKRLVTLLVVMITICAICLTGCGKKEDKSDSPSSTESAEATEAPVTEKDYLEVQTSIAYSNGDTKNWTYGNQRKEFPNNESCYVRIGSTMITTGSFGKGDGDSASVIYRFTGTKDCPVVISDGKATKVETGDPNITEYSFSISASKKKEAKETVLVFRYSPKGAESVTLEVIYDDQLAAKYDEYNTIYFDKVPDTVNEIH